MKGTLLVVALIASFIALARPQFGRGQKLVPATNLDVVIVLDYSKSMYARDVAPSRIARAKAEVGRLVRDLPGARFGAVAFAGEPMVFPMTSDGNAIAHDGWHTARIGLTGPGWAALKNGRFEKWAGLKKRICRTRLRP